jgi:NhaP-type Na+/H+ or K+/H+ antiporter
MATVAAPPVRSRSQSKLVLFLIFGLLTVFVTYMKNARVFDPTSEVAQHFAPVRWYLLPHLFSVSWP